MPHARLVNQVNEEIDRMTLLDRDLPSALRITFLQLVNVVLELDHNEVASNPKFVGFLQRRVIDTADERDMRTLEGIIGLDLLACAIGWKDGGQGMTGRIFEPQSIELQKMQKIFL